MTPTVLIAGAGRGVGRATIDAFLAEGWNVVAGVRNVPALTEELRDTPGVTVVHLDMVDRASIAAAMDAAERVAGGALGALVLNAAHAVMGAAEDVDLDEARLMFETNFFGHMAVVQAALPAMREAGAGAIVCVGSIGSHFTNPLLSVYHASKAAMYSWADGLRIEMRPFGVHVHTVEPGMITSEFAKSTRYSGALVDGEGPYPPLLDQVRRAYTSWRERDGVSSETVARAVVGAATDPTSPFRVLIGDDAAAMNAAMRAHPDDAFTAWWFDYVGIRWPADP